MRALARVVAEFVDGRTVLRELRSMAPLTLVPHRGNPGLVHLVSSATAPLGGDDLELRLEAGPGATLTLAGVAASIVLPGHRPGVSRFTVHVEAAEGSTVEYRPEATVVTARADHEAVFRASLAAGADLTTRELIVLGRDGERPGCLSTSTIVHRAGRPVLNQCLRIDDTAASPAVLAGRRVLATELRITGDDPRQPYADDWCARVPLAAGGSMTTALAHDTITAGRLLDQLDRSG